MNVRRSGYTTEQSPCVTFLSSAMNPYWTAGQCNCVITNQLHSVVGTGTIFQQESGQSQKSNVIRACRHRRNLRGLRGVRVPPTFWAYDRKNSRRSLIQRSRKLKYPGKRLADGDLPQKPSRGSYRPHTSSYLRNGISTI